MSGWNLPSILDREAWRKLEEAPCDIHGKVERKYYLGSVYVPLCPICEDNLLEELKKAREKTV